MGKLLSANFFSMIRSKRFWVGAILMAVVGAGSAWDVYRMQAQGFDMTLDGSLWSGAAVLFLVAPALGALFINTDYHDGTIRNKLTVGRGRAQVYVSNLLMVYAVTLFYLVLGAGLTWLAGAALGIPVAAPEEAAGKLLLFAVMFLALSAIATQMATLIVNRSALILTVMMAMGLLFGGQIIDSMLQDPEMMDDYNGVTFITEEDGSVSMQYMDKEGNPIDPKDIPRVPNPRYVREPWRTALRTFNQIQPGGQLSEIILGSYAQYDPEQGAIVDMETPKWLLVTYSLGLALAFTGAGILLFRRKDLK